MLVAKDYEGARRLALQHIMSMTKFKVADEKMAVDLLDLMVQTLEQGVDRVGQGREEGHQVLHNPVFHPGAKDRGAPRIRQAALD